MGFIGNVSGASDGSGSGNTGPPQVLRGGHVIKWPPPTHVQSFDVWIVWSLVGFTPCAASLQVVVVVVVSPDQMSVLLVQTRQKPNVTALRSD